MLKRLKRFNFCSDAKFSKLGAAEEKFNNVLATLDAQVSRLVVFLFSKIAFLKKESELNLNSRRVLFCTINFSSGFCCVKEETVNLKKRVVR
jgi:hypothetical protein